LKAENDTTRRFVVNTLGCKVNQYESDVIITSLKENGWVQGHGSETADLYIINTCTVTGKAAMQARQAIRKAIRCNPESCIVVTGCYAQTEPDEIKKIKGVHYIIGQSDKHKLPEIIIAATRNHFSRPVETPETIWHDISRGAHFHPARLPAATGNRTRPLLKVQDGCNAFCTYCIVPYARGRSRSLPVKTVLEQIRHIHQSGFDEVVLTGTHLGCYGLSLTPPAGLFELLTRIHDSTSIPRIRLSSIEPNEITDNMIDLVANSHRFCNHFHVPLQSGDDRILQQMNRPYTNVFFKNRIHYIHDRIPDGAIGADVLIGFPGETESAFENTFRLIESLPVTYLHVFPFSPRKGTPAGRFPDQIAPRIIKERCLKIRGLGIRKKRDFYQRFVGKTVDVLIEETKPRLSGLQKGITSNYVPVFIHSTSPLKNTIVSVKIERVVQENNPSHSIFCKGTLPSP